MRLFDWLILIDLLIEQWIPWLFDRLLNEFVDFWLIVWTINWLIVCVVVWLFGCFIGCLLNGLMMAIMIMRRRREEEDENQHEHENGSMLHIAAQGSWFCICVLSVWIPKIAGERDAVGFSAATAECWPFRSCSQTTKTRGARIEASVKKIDR